jgi:hypothetical protein
MTIELEWHYFPKRRCDKSRDPVQDEFFQSDQEDESQVFHFVREVLQNSLDARRDPNKPVKAAIHVRDLSNKIDILNKKWFANAWDHIEAPNNGLSGVSRKSLTSSKTCRFLLIEDFNTTGLEGDIEEHRSSFSGDNPFFYFYRSEGMSAKQNEKGGRWGLGKYVFPRASAIRSFIGYSVRKDQPKAVIMGQSILRYHELKGVEYNPDGWFCKVQRVASEEMPMPGVTPTIIKEFCEDFNILRKKQTGLSIIVPFAEQVFNAKSLRKAVVEQFFLSILRGDLEVGIFERGVKHTITKDSIGKEVTQIENQRFNTATYLELARVYNENHQVIPLDTLQPKGIGSLTIKDGQINETMKSNYQKGDILHFKIPVEFVMTPINKKVSSYFHVILKSDLKSGASKPVFFRGHLRINDLSDTSSPHAHALVIIDEIQLSSMLGDAENPAHNRWSSNCSNFRGKYKNGQRVMAFVRKCPRLILDQLLPDEGKEDESALSHIFPILDGSKLETEDDLGPVTTGTGSTTPTKVNVTNQKQKLQIQEIKGGFKVVSGEDIPRKKDRFLVKVAYKAKENSFSKYNLLDFDFMNPKASGIKLNLDGASTSGSRYGNNNVEFSIEKPDEIYLQITGFDENRDLLVDLDEVDQ